MASSTVGVDSRISPKEAMERVLARSGDDDLESIIMATRQRPGSRVYEVEVRFRCVRFTGRTNVSKTCAFHLAFECALRSTPNCLTPAEKRRAIRWLQPHREYIHGEPGDFEEEERIASFFPFKGRNLIVEDDPNLLELWTKYQEYWREDESSDESEDEESNDANDVTVLRSGRRIVKYRA